MKRGQVSLFIIIGIIILVVVVLLFFSRANFKAQDLQIKIIENYIDTCIDAAGLSGFYYVGLQGGFVDVLEPKEDYYSWEVPIYWDNGVSSIPSKEIIEQEISKYLEITIPECMNKLKESKQEDIEISMGEMSLVDFKINDAGADVELNYPISVKKGESTTEFKEFKKWIDFDFTGKYNIVNQIIEEQKRVQDSFPIGYITHLAYENDFTFELVNLEGDNILVSLIFEKENYLNRSFIYQFVNKYDWGEHFGGLEEE